MIPIRDNIRSNSTPIVGYCLILLNAYVFYQELVVDELVLDWILEQFGLIPIELMSGIAKNPLHPLLYLPLVTNLFIHGGWLHIIGNMWYLKIFGDNIEDRLGHFGFLVFYLLCGIAANLAQVFIDPSSDIPTIGASGAISGILGAYLLSFPWAKVSTFVPIFFFFTVVEIPAIIFLGFWFYLQLQSGTASLTMVGSNVAWWAHVGGFMAGAILILLFPKRR